MASVSVGRPNPGEFPRRVNVEVTNRCNQACRFCPRDGFTRPLGLMDASLFERVAIELARHRSTMWLHFLGEPLLHPGLVEMVRFAVASGVASVGLSTNATLLKGPLADELLHSGLHRLDISLDAVDAEAYRHMRGTDDFLRVNSNVERFLERRLEHDDPGPQVALQFVLAPELNPAAPAALRRWSPLLGEGDFVKTIVPAQFHGTIDGGDVAPSPAKRPPCSWLFESLMVLQDGTVTMCGADWDAAAPLGHLDAGTTIEAIWHGEEARRRRHAHLEGRFEDVALCGDCTDWHLADGHGYRNALSVGEDPHVVKVSLGRRSSGQGASQERVSRPVE